MTKTDGVDCVLNCYLHCVLFGVVREVFLCKVKNFAYVNSVCCDERGSKRSPSST